MTSVCQKTEIIRLLLPPCNANGGSTVANLQVIHTHNSYNLQFFKYRTVQRKENIRTHSLTNKTKQNNTIQYYTKIYHESFS